MSTTQLAGVVSAFALVVYLPEPLGSYLDSFRTSLSGRMTAKAHLTLLPPRQVRIDPHTASGHIARTLRQFRPFEVELTSVTRFPKTNVIYLAVGKGSEEASRLHEALNRDVLAYDEPFDYIPHVTLFLPPAGAGEAQIADLQQITGHHWRKFDQKTRFLVDHLDLVRQSSDGAWQKVSNIPLGFDYDEPESAA